MEYIKCGIRTDGTYTNEGKSYIGYAQSVDGINWERFDAPVLVPDRGWELKLSCVLMLYMMKQKKYIRCGIRRRRQS